jgi:outer membrane protein
MKRSFSVVCLLASVAAGTVASSTSAFAQAASALAPAPSAPADTSAATPVSFGPAKVAIIAFQQAVAATNEGQRNFAQLRTKFEPKQTQLKTQSDEIDAMKKQLQDAGTTLSEPERESRLRTIDEKTKSLQRSAEDAQTEASNAMNEMYQQLAQKVYAVLDSYASGSKFTLVLDASNQQNSPVLWATPSTDITKAVVDAYNTKSGIPAQPAGAAAPAATRPSTGAPRTTPRPGAGTKAPQ